MKTPLERTNLVYVMLKFLLSGWYIQNSLAEVQALLFGHHNGCMADDLVTQLVTLLVDGDHRAAPARPGRGSAARRS